MNNESNATTVNTEAQTFAITQAATQTFFSLRNRKAAPLAIEIVNAKNILDSLVLGSETDAKGAYVAKHSR